MTISRDEASATLASMNATKRQLAAAANCPPQRHLAFALLIGMAISLPGFPILVVLMLEALLIVAMYLIVQWDRRRTGLFINGYRMGRTRPLTFLMLGIFIALVMISVRLKSWGIDWAPFAMGVAGTAIAYAFSVQWQKLFRRELGSAG